MDLVASEKNFTLIVACAAFVAFWAIWVALTWKPPIEGRLHALRTRRAKTRSEQTASSKQSTKAASIGLMRKVADRLNLLRGSAADQTSRAIIIFLISAIALAGFRPFGQVLAQFMMVWQR